MPLNVTRWLGAEPPNPDALLAERRASGQDHYTWGNAPGDTYAVHTHTYRKQLICLAGSITFMLPATGERIELHPGDELEMPPGTPHGAVVGPGGVRCAEAHLPSSEGTRSLAK